MDIIESMFFSAEGTAISFLDDFTSNDGNMG
jgi:hypothetical protein